MALPLAKTSAMAAHLLEAECVVSVLRRHIIQSRPTSIDEANTAINHCIAQLVAARQAMIEAVAVAEMAATLEASL